LNAADIVENDSVRRRFEANFAEVFNGSTRLNTTVWSQFPGENAMFSLTDQASQTSSVSLFDKLKWMTSKEAALYIRVSVGQLRNMVWRGQIKAYHLKNRLRFLRSDLDILLKPAF
jgi:excisionase family DNA binding protein